MGRPLTVLISGAGIAGPAVAYWLVRAGHRVTLVERCAALRTGGHAVDVRGTALHVVERMGLAGAVRDARTQILALSAVRGAGPRTYDIALRPLHEARGDREIEIMRDDLGRLLFDAIADAVEVVFDDAVRSVVGHHGGPVTVELERTGSREVDLVVGADGQHSATRGLVFGSDARFTRHLGAYLSIFTVDNTFGLTDRAILYNEPGRGAAMFTVRGNGRAKVVLLFRSEPLDIDIRDETAQRALLRARFAGMGWHTEELVDSLQHADGFYFDEMSQVTLPRWSAGRVVLLGDAASARRHCPARAPRWRSLGLICWPTNSATAAMSVPPCLAGRRVFARMSPRISVWPPRGCPLYCRRRGPASCCAIRHCGYCRCWPGWASDSAGSSNGHRGR